MKWPIILSNFNLILNLKEIRPVTVALMHAVRRTDMTKVTYVFSNYANAPKMSTLEPNMRYHNKKNSFCEHGYCRGSAIKKYWTNESLLSKNENYCMWSS